MRRAGVVELLERARERGTVVVCRSVERDAETRRNACVCHEAQAKAPAFVERSERVHPLARALEAR